MTAALSIRLDDAINPIVIKELRQAIQSRFISGVLTLFLIIQLFVIGGWLISDERIADNFSAGRDIFIVLHGIVLGTCLFFVPFYTAARFSAERSDANVDLLFITTLRPRTIVWGKLLSGILISALIYSACLPFFTLTYLLRGIDLPTIFVILGADALAVGVVIQASVLIGCLSINRAAKMLLSAAFFMGLSSCFIYVLGATSVMMYTGVGSLLGTATFWWGVLVSVGLAAAAGATLMVLAVVTLMPPSANRALPARLCFTAAWLLSGLLCFTLAVAAGEPFYFQVWRVIMIIALCAVMLASFSERDEYGVRLRRSIPRPGGRRAAAFLFYSGPLGGVAWCLVMAALTLGAVRLSAAMFSSFTFSPGRGVDDWRLVALLLYFLTYGLTATLIRWAFFRRHIRTSANVALAFFLMMLGSLAPILISFFISPTRFNNGPDKYWMLGNPFGVFIFQEEWRDPAVPIGVLGVWLALLAVPALRWIKAQVRNFQPLAETAIPVQMAGTAESHA